MKTIQEQVAIIQKVMTKKVNEIRITDRRLLEMVKSHKQASNDYNINDNFLNSLDEGLTKYGKLTDGQRSALESAARTFDLI